MDELTITDVDAQMGYAASTGVEENKITGLQIGFAYPTAGCKLLLAGSGKRDAMQIKYVLHKTGAIETIRCSAAPQIGDTNVLTSGSDDLLRRCRSVLAI